MEGKRIPTIVVILLTIVGTCLVGFGVWYGVGYFKGGDKPSVPDTPVEESTTDVIEDYVEGEYHTYIVYSSKNSDNYKKVDYSELFVLKPYDEAEEGVLISDDNVIALKGYPDAKNRSLKVEEKIVSALIDSDCGGSISIYYLTESKNLYYSDLYNDSNDHSDSFKGFLISKNVEKIGYANLNRFTTCGGKTIAYKKVGSDINYIANGYYDVLEKKIVVGSKDMKYANYEEALYSADHSELLVIYKNYPKDALNKNSVALKDDNGKDLYVKGIFASTEQIKKGYNYLYFLGEDNYLYYYPNGYSSKNVKAVKYNDSKVKKITSSRTEGWEPAVLTIEYENGKIEKINIDSYAGAANLNL